MALRDADLPLFYFTASERTAPDRLDPSPDTLRHIGQVLRMKPGEELLLTDGAGCIIRGRIDEIGKKSGHIRILDEERSEAPAPHLTVCISPLKQRARFEWFLEKATEIGINRIVPLICERTERDSYRFDRLNAILQSALIQSRQSHMPELSAPVRWADWIASSSSARRLIAHCGVEDTTKPLLTANNTCNSEILIGPEGDFTAEEVKQALNNGYQPVSLGQTRLRTETAGIVAATLLRLGHRAG